MGAFDKALSIGSLVFGVVDRVRDWRKDRRVKKVETKVRKVESLVKKAKADLEAVARCPIVMANGVRCSRAAMHQGAHR